MSADAPQAKRLDFTLWENVDVTDISDRTGCVLCARLHVRPRSDVCDGSPLARCDSRSRLLSYQIPLALLSLLMCGAAAAAAALCKPLQLVFFFLLFLFLFCPKSFFLRRKKKSLWRLSSLSCSNKYHFCSPSRFVPDQLGFSGGFFSLSFFSPSFPTVASQIQ